MPDLVPMFLITNGYYSSYYTHRVQWVPVGHLGHLENLVMMVKQANLANQESVGHLGLRVTLDWMVPRVKLVLQVRRVKLVLQVKAVLLVPWVLVVFLEREDVPAHLVLL
uniref:Uncharacterized protein n=1 Tax=Sphaerodactylus townsendi TaxID=933632 RepID=A0ACB8ENY6_9SAUR